MVVNDGSTDNTDVILNEFQKTDKRIKVFNQTNKGIYLARKRAIQEANYDYIVHLDSDDYLLPNAIEILWAKMKNSEYDIVVSNHYQITGDKKVLINNEIGDGGNIDAIKNLLNGGLTSYLWGRLFKKSVFQEISIPKTGRIYTEDVLTNLAIFSAQDLKIGIVNEPTVCYRVHTDLNSYSRAPQNVQAIFDEVQVVKKMLEAGGSIQKFDNEYAGYKSRSWVLYCRMNGLKVKSREYRWGIFKENFFKGFIHMPFYQRIELIAYTINPMLGRISTKSMKWIKDRL